eukprot:6181025-Pleurochrysis_carterae.AAC.5
MPKLKHCMRVRSSRIVGVLCNWRIRRLEDSARKTAARTPRSQRISKRVRQDSHLHTSDSILLVLAFRTAPQTTRAVFTRHVDKFNSSRLALAKRKCHRYLCAFGSLQNDLNSVELKRHAQLTSGLRCCSRLASTRMIVYTTLLKPQSSRCARWSLVGKNLVCATPHARGIARTGGSLCWDGLGAYENCLASVRCYHWESYASLRIQTNDFIVHKSYQVCFGFSGRLSIAHSAVYEPVCFLRGPSEV